MFVYMCVYKLLPEENAEGHQLFGGGGVILGFRGSLLFLLFFKIGPPLSLLGLFFFNLGGGGEIGRVGGGTTSVMCRVLPTTFM